MEPIVSSETSTIRTPTPGNYPKRNNLHLEHGESLRTRPVYLLTPWCRVLLKKLTGLQLVKKFPTFHGTPRFFTALTSVRHLSLSWANPIQSIHPHPRSWRSILILSTHLLLGLPSGLLPSGFTTHTLYTHLSSPVRAICPAHLILLDFITRTILGEEYNLFSSSLCNLLHSPVTSSLLRYIPVYLLTYILTYLLAPSCRVLLKKLIGLQLVKKFPALHGTRKFITATTSVRKLSLSWARPIQSIYPHPTSWRSILILSTHLRLGLPSGLFPPVSTPRHYTPPSPTPYMPRG